MKDFFKDLRWFNWGAMIPTVCIYNVIVYLAGGDPNKGALNVIGWILCGIQVFCLVVLVYIIIRDRRRHKRRMRELDATEAQIDSSGPRFTDEQREEIMYRLAMLREILNEHKQAQEGKGDLN